MQTSNKILIKYSSLKYLIPNIFLSFQVLITFASKVTITKFSHLKRQIKLCLK